MCEKFAASVFVHEFLGHRIDENMREIRYAIICFVWRLCDVFHREIANVL